MNSPFVFKLYSRNVGGREILSAYSRRAWQTIPSFPPCKSSGKCRSNQDPEPNPRSQGNPQRVNPGVALEPGFAVRKLGPRQRRTVDSFQHAQAEQGHQRPFGATGAAEGSGNGGCHRTAVENMREEGAPPQARKADASDVHLALGEAEEFTSAHTPGDRHHRARRKRDGAARLVNGAKQNSILGVRIAPRFGQVKLKEGFLAHGHGASPYEQVVAGTQQARNRSVPDAAHERPEVRRLRRVPTIASAGSHLGIGQRRGQSAQPVLAHAAPTGSKSEDLRALS